MGPLLNYRDDYDPGEIATAVCEVLGAWVAYLNAELESVTPVTSLDKQQERNSSQVEQSPVAPQEQSSSKDKVGVKKSWTEVQKQLVEMHDSGIPYSDTRTLAKKIGCSVSTINKAIKPSEGSLAKLDEPGKHYATKASITLRAWRAKKVIPTNKPSVMGLNEAIEDQLKQTRETDPSTELASVESEAKIREYIATLSDEKKKWLQSLPLDEQREAIRLMLEDPDKGFKVLKRRP